MQNDQLYSKISVWSYFSLFPKIETYFPNLDQFPIHNKKCLQWTVNKC